MIYFKNIFKISTLMIVIGLMTNNSYSQCTNPNNNGASNLQNCNWASRSIGSGEYADFSVTRCRRYVFELNPYSGWNMQMTGRGPGTTTTQLFYSQGTGLRQVFWTATFTGTVRVHVNRSTCGMWQGAGLSSTLRYRDHGDLANTAAGATATPTAGTWRGGVSNLWTLNTNWDCNAIPGATTRVNIPGPCLNNPTIPTATTANVYCIRVDGANGAQLNIAGTGAINVTGPALDGRCN
jgi:hypothetical protein